MSMKTLRTCAVCLLVLAMCYVAVHMFSIEILALGWHVIHGRTAHLRSSFCPQYDVNVPTLTAARLDESGWNLFLFYRSMRQPMGNHRPTRIREYPAFVSWSRPLHVPPASWDWKRMQKTYLAEAY
jgi:hypothetical protein